AACIRPVSWAGLPGKGRTGRSRAACALPGIVALRRHNMRKFFVSLLLILGMAGTTTAQSTDPSAPSYDLKAQALLDLEGVQKKFVDLANAVPADKFAWKPSEDTRSFAEVLMHVAGERYQILRLMGATPPADFNGKTFEK